VLRLPHHVYCVYRVVPICDVRVFILPLCEGARYSTLVEPRYPVVHWRFQEKGGHSEHGYAGQNRYGNFCLFLHGFSAIHRNRRRVATALHGEGFDEDFKAGDAEDFDGGVGGDGGGFAEAVDAVAVEVDGAGGAEGCEGGAASADEGSELGAFFGKRFLDVGGWGFEEDAAADGGVGVEADGPVEEEGGEEDDTDAEEEAEGGAGAGGEDDADEGHDGGADGEDAVGGDEEFGPDAGEGGDEEEEGGGEHEGPRSWKLEVGRGVR
jgi:hypothetical protein